MDDRYVIWKRTPFGGWSAYIDRGYRFRWTARIAAAWNGSREFPCVVCREGESPTKRDGHRRLYPASGTTR